MAGDCQRGYMVWDAGKLKTPRKVTVLAENETAELWSDEGEAGVNSAGSRGIHAQPVKYSDDDGWES